MARYSEAVEPGTVWTWNAIGKAAGRLEPRAGRQRIAARLPAQSPDHRGAAGRRRRRARFQFRPGHRPGRLVRRARAHLPGRRRRAQADLAAVRAYAAAARASASEPRSGSRISARQEERQAMTQLALVIDLNVCVGCHACVTSCKEWNTSGAAGPLCRRQSLRRGPDRHVLQPRADLRGRRVSRTRRRCISRSPACTARIRPACRCARPARATSAPRTASCWSTTTSASAASTARGPAPTARASSTSSSKVMKKCTLCVDRIYDTALPEARAQARLRAGLPDQRAAVRRHPRSRVGGLEGDPRERRLRADAGVGHASGQPLPAAPQDQPSRSIEDELERAGQSAQGRRPAAEAGDKPSRRSTT